MDVDSVVADLMDFLNASPADPQPMQISSLINFPGFIQTLIEFCEQMRQRSDRRLLDSSTCRREKTGAWWYVAGNEFHIVGAHIDSPCLKVKPASKVKDVILQLECRHTVVVCGTLDSTGTWQLLEGRCSILLP